MRFILFGSILLMVIPLIIIVINWMIYNLTVPIIILFEEKEKRDIKLKEKKMYDDRERYRKHFEFVDKIVQRKKDEDERK